MSATPQVVPVKTFEGHELLVQCVAWHPDERWIVTGLRDGKLQIWDIQTGLQLGEDIKGHDMTLLALDVSPDGTTIASGSEDKTIRLWNGESGELIHTCEGHEGAVRDIHFSPDSRRIASCSEDQTLRIWDTRTGELLFEPVKCEDWVWVVRYSPNGDRIASGGNNIQIWDVSGSGVDLTMTIEDDVTSLAWTHDGEQLIVGGKGMVTVWNASLGQRICRWKALTGWIRLSPSPTTTHLATCSWNAHRAVLFDTNTGKRLNEYGHCAVSYVAYSPSGKFIATACDDKRVYLWEAPQSSRSPGSSILDLPATIRPGLTDRAIEHFPGSATFDLPDMFQPLPSLQPTNHSAHRYGRMLRRTTDGIFRRRGRSQQQDNCPSQPNAHDGPIGTFRSVLSYPQFLFPSISRRKPFSGESRRCKPPASENERNQEDRTPEGNWVAEARTRPIYAFETGPLPDEVERGCFFHLASYICYGRRDPNIAIQRDNVQTCAIDPAPGISAPASEATAMYNRRPSTHLPATTVPTVTHVSTSTSIRIRILLSRFFTSLGSRLHPGANPSPAGTPGDVGIGHTPPQIITGLTVPTIVITGPSPEPVDQANEATVAQQASPPLSLSTTSTVSSSSDVFSPSSSAGRVAESLDTIHAVSQNGTSMFKSFSEHCFFPPVAVDVRSPVPAHSNASNTASDPPPVHLHPRINTLVGPLFRDGDQHDSNHALMISGSGARTLQVEVFEDGSGLFENPWADPS